MKRGTSVKNKALVSENFKKKHPILAEILDWVKIIVSAAVIAWLCNHILIMNTVVPSGSMEDTIPKPSRIISSRISYWFSDPERGDVILFDPPDGSEYCYVKRIIGLPGETVEIRDGLVYINGSDEPLDEPYVKGTPTGDFGPYEVPEDSYFVMGDNRNNSTDSRYWHTPYVSRKAIYAKAIFGYWPSLFWVK
jgi:signal peptidase I